MWVDLRSLWEGPPAGGQCWTADSGTVKADSPYYTADSGLCPTPPSAFTSGFFRVSYQFPESEGEYARANHQVYWQIARRPAPQTTGISYFVRPSAFPEIDAEPQRTNHQLYFQIARQPPVQQPSLALTLFRSSYRLPETEIEYSRGDHQTYWQFRAPMPPVAPEVPPAAGGGLLPGRPPCPPEKLGMGMGPYKRPGQVFGEPDPLSPRLSSRAEVAAGYVPRTPLTQQLPLIDFPPPVTLAEQDDTDTVVFALVALDELCGSPTDLLRGPITLKIVRRKI